MAQCGNSGCLLVIAMGIIVGQSTHCGRSSWSMAKKALRRGEFQRIQIWHRYSLSLAASKDRSTCSRPMVKKPGMQVLACNPRRSWLSEQGQMTCRMCIGGSGGGRATSGFSWHLSPAGGCSEDELGFEAAARTAKNGFAFLLPWKAARSWW